MEVYKRVVDRVRGAMWAHHRRLLPERQAQRILGYVYNNKYEYQIRFDRMTLVGTELDGKVEVATNPAGFIKKVRVNPEFEDLPRADQERLIISAYSNAMKQGRDLMQQAEEKIYGQFLRDIKPLVMGIRDNPEFYTVAPDSVELRDGILKSSSSSQNNNNNNSNEIHRTIPYDRNFSPSDEIRQRERNMDRYLTSAEGKKFLSKLRGKEYAKFHLPERRPAGAPGAKKRAKKLEIPVPYQPFDEKALLRRNWQAYLDNRNVAEKIWTRVRLGDRIKQTRLLQKSGQAWHSPIVSEAPRF